MKKLLTITLIFIIPLVAFSQRPVDDFEKCIENLSKVLAKPVKVENEKIAISEFYTLDGTRSIYSRFINEELTVRMFQTGKFQILEKGRLEKVLKEQKMELNGTNDEAVAKKLKELLKVGAILAGTIVEYDDILRLYVRLISTETGLIISAGTVNLDKRVVVPSYITQKNINDTTKKSFVETDKNIVHNNQTQIKTNSGNCFAVALLGVSKVSDGVIYKITFTNFGDNAELNFGFNNLNSIDLLFPSGSSARCSSVSVLNGKTLNQSDPIVSFAKGTPKILLFKFQIVQTQKPVSLNIPVKGACYESGGVITVNL